MKKIKKASMDGIGAHCALFLDFDGTLADLAARPEGVAVAPGLVDTLASLAHLLGGALAVVSGRPIDQLDAFLNPLALPSAGVHGAQRRRADGTIEHFPSAIPASLIGNMQALADRHAGVLLESKPGAIALHYRLAPQFEAVCVDALQAAAREHQGFTLLVGKMVAELKPAAVTKGRAIDAFLSEAPFSGRRPVFAGDDTTDEAGFEAVQRRGGVGIKVGAGFSSAHWMLDSPHALRQWLVDMQRMLQKERTT